jgi:hypothetical protein
LVAATIVIHQTPIVPNFPWHVHQKQARQLYLSGFKWRKKLNHLFPKNCDSGYKLSQNEIIKLLKNTGAYL